MKIKTKETTLSDGFTVHDVDLFANGNETFMGQPICIFSCRSERDMIAFLNGLKRLVAKHTCETLDEV
jgi:hypothetical protein